tara:strand:- start:20045 stop:21346 length:1302 start_codon:yes stop_codon:yes gene_type:complete
VDIINDIKAAFKKNSSYKECLFRYTTKINLKSDFENFLLNTKNNLFYISYPNNITYIAIDRCKEYMLQSSIELINLKDIKYNLNSYGEKKNSPLKIFGGCSFNIEKKGEDIWDDIPKSLFFIPKFLIIKNNNEYYVSYHKFIDKSSNPDKINSEFNLFLKNLINPFNIKEKTKLSIDLNIPDKKMYSNIFTNLSASIKNQDIEKIVLSRLKKISINNKVILKKTSSTNFYIDLTKNKRFLGTTPELLIKVKNKKVKTSAIAGTLKKHSTKSNLNNFLNDKKERSEHQYVVDDLKTKINNYCKKINISENPKVLELEYLYHLYTSINGTLNDNTHILELANILHPTPAVLGTPKDKVLNIIEKNEPFDRGWYSGYIGWYDTNGDGRFDVAIRSGLQTNSHLYCYAGGGLVKESKENHEWDETELKFQNLLLAIK